MNARNNAVQGSLNNAAKAIQVCLTGATPVTCDNLGEISLDCKSDTSATNTYQIDCPMSYNSDTNTTCVSLIKGDAEGCVEVNTSTGASDIQINESTYDVCASGECD